MTSLLHFLYKILPCSVLTYLSVRGGNALFASVVLYSLCTALVNFTLQFPQFPVWSCIQVYKFKCILSCSVLLGCPQDLAGLQCPQHQAHAELQGAPHILGSFQSHHLKDTNTGSISQEWHEETPQACHQYRPHLTNGQQRQYSSTQPMFVFREGCSCKERD